jgi:hypothetical protein
LPAARANALARALIEADFDEGVVAARANADWSLDLNRAAVLLQLRIAGFDDELALTVWQRDHQRLRELAIAALSHYSVTLRRATPNCSRSQSSGDRSGRQRRNFPG